MKKTLNVNIGSVAFVIDEDAYHMLKRYLDDIATRVEPGVEKETIDDLEMRIADIFLENLSSSRQVVNIELVKNTIAIIGSADEFGERKGSYYNQPKADIRSLRRSRSERVIGGVCGGIAEYFGIDVSLVRLLTFIFIFFGGISFFIYIIMWIIIPSEPEFSSYNSKNGSSR